MSEGPQRLDKWLWFARFVRTRVLAQALVEAGRVRINRERTTSSSRLVRAGDVLTIALPGGVRVVEVAGFAARRGQPADAARLYVERTERPPG